MKANYHTHTRWCKHATGEIEDYLQEALNKGLKELAITEHVPHEDNLDQWRMWWEEFDAYNTALDKAIARYQDRLHVIKGFEAEYYPEEMAQYERFRRELGYELFVLGQHRCGPNRAYNSFGTKGVTQIRAYVHDLCEGIKTGLFKLVAHPDLILTGYEGGFDEEIQSGLRTIYATCEKYNIPVEINANGLREHQAYPSRQALELSKDYSLRYIVSADAHHPEDLVDTYVLEAEKMAADLGIQLLQTLDL